ncbi:hypothetical protein BDZ45DRAFT_754864 [Acephala macrosclerotiorum]|nr:hypothetical protein BDZ45DRAFT_754864 [Acephala macrosclerotiorum]
MEMDLSSNDSDLSDLHSSTTQPSTSFLAVDLQLEQAVTPDDTTVFSASEDMSSASYIGNSDSGRASVQEMDSATTIIVATPSTSSSAIPHHSSISDTQAQSSGETFDKFHPFPRLPIELRLAIWKFASPTPATLYMTAYADDYSPLPFWFEPTKEPKRSTALLRACHESREAYLLEFPSALPILMTNDWDAHMHAWWTDRGNWPTTTKWSECVMRFGPKDTIHFDNPFELFWEREFWEVIEEEDWVKDIKTLEIDSDDYSAFEASDWVTVLKHFTGLQRIEVREVESYDPRDLTEQVWKDEWKKMKSSILEMNIKGIEVPEMVWLRMEV